MLEKIANGIIGVVWIFSVVAIIMGWTDPPLWIRILAAVTTAVAFLHSLVTLAAERRAD